MSDDYHGRLKLKWQTKWSMRRSRQMEMLTVSCFFFTDKESRNTKGPSEPFLIMFEVTKQPLRRASDQRA